MYTKKRISTNKCTIKYDGSQIIRIYNIGRWKIHKLIY